MMNITILYYSNNTILTILTLMLVIQGMIYLHSLDAQQMAITTCTGGAWEMFMGNVHVVQRNQ